MTVDSTDPVATDSMGVTASEPGFVRRSRMRAIVIGSAAGAVVGLAIAAYITGKYALGSIEVIGGKATYTLTTGAAYIGVIVFAALAGLLIGGFVYAYAESVEPDAAKFPASAILPIAAVTAAIMAYSVFRLGVEITGNVGGGSITVPVAELVVVALWCGLIGGAVTTGVTDALARPEFLNVDESDVPETGGALARQMIDAIGAPLLAIVGGAVFAIALSQLLLSLSGAAAVAVFSVVAAIVLGGATLIALRPWDKSAGST